MISYTESETAFISPDTTIKKSPTHSFPLKSCIWSNATFVLQKDSEKSLVGTLVTGSAKLGIFSCRNVHGKSVNNFSLLLATDPHQTQLLFMDVRSAINICFKTNIRSQLFVTSITWKSEWILGFSTYLLESFLFWRKSNGAKAKLSPTHVLRVKWWIANAKDLFSSSRTENNLFWESKSHECAQPMLNVEPLRHVM